MKEQLLIDKVQPAIKSCAFTGHRELQEDFSVRALRKAVKQLIQEGCSVFYCGMAQGFDLLAAEAVLKHKKAYPGVKLIACLPCDNQEKYYPAAEKKRYASIVKKADEQVLLSPHYFRGCMLMRDRYMADAADALIAYLRKDKGGTAYTVQYFTKKYPLKRCIFL